MAWGAGGIHDMLKGGIRAPGFSSSSSFIDAGTGIKISGVPSNFGKMNISPINRGGAGVKETGGITTKTRTGYTSGPKVPDLLRPDKFTKKTTQLTEWRRSIDPMDIANERKLFLGEDSIKVDAGKWRSLDGTRQFRVKPQDYLGEHSIGKPSVPNIPHVHLEFLQPSMNGTKFDVVKNVHVPIK